MIHARVEFWRSRPGSAYRVLMPIWILLWIVFAGATAPWRNMVFYQTAWAWIPAAALFALGIWIYTQSGKKFSLAQLGGLPELRTGHTEQRLVTSGLRNNVRHPIYLAHLCEMLAWSVGTGLVVCYGLTLFAMVTGAVMIRMEDRELESRFGEAFRQYRINVPAILPSGRRRHFLGSALLGTSAENRDSLSPRL